MTLTPNDLPRPPRRVRGWISGGGSAWFGRIFTLPHTLVGIGATLYWLFLVLWVLFGTNLKGTVTGTDTSYSSKSGRHYQVKFSYVAGGETRTGSGSVSPAEWERFRAQTQAEDASPNSNSNSNSNSSLSPGPTSEVVVRYFAVGPLRHAELRTSSSEAAWSSAGFFTIWVVFWDSIVGVFFYMLWIQPLRVRRIYKHGEATGGTVTDKRAIRGKSTTYYVDYVFNEPTTGREFKGKTRVWRSGDWDRAMNGQRVIVLYWRGNPKRSVVYEFGGYEVETEGNRSLGKGKETANERQ